MSKLLIAGAALASVLAVAAPARSEVHVSVNIGAPPVFVAQPPPLVVVPQQTEVYYAPGYDYNLFFYRGRYYTQFNGAWFFTTRVGGAWFAVSDVPRPIRAVPVEYIRVKPGHERHCPPGQAKKGRC